MQSHWLQICKLSESLSRNIDNMESDVAQLKLSAEAEAHAFQNNSPYSLRVEFPSCSKFEEHKHYLR